MPPLPRLRIAALEDLARQLRFAPPETLRKQLERAEIVAGEIDPQVNYPEDWLVYRITGYRPEIDEPATFVGEALLGEMSALIERLSDAAGLRHDDPDAGPTLDAAALCERWKISRKTLDRLRRRGLIARRVMGERGKPRLAFPLAAVERFEAREGDRLRRAGEFSRIEPELQRRMIRRAAVYRRRLRCSLNAAAMRLARRFGRSHEAVRQMLMRHDAASPAPIFKERPRLESSHRRLAWRAHVRGIEPSVVAKHLGRTRATVHRLVTLERARRLRELGLTPAAHGRDAAADPLTATPARSGLGAPGHTDLLELITAARASEAPLGAVEQIRAAAYHRLVGRAATAANELPFSWPSAETLDRIETDLRWAARLKAELVRSQLPLALRTLESLLSRPAELTRPAALRALIDEAIAALAESVDVFDPTGRGRLAAPAGLALQRRLSRWIREHPGQIGDPPGAGRASPTLRPGVRIVDWTLRVAPWQSERGPDGRAAHPWLEPDPRLRATLPRVRPDLASLLARRFGWDGLPPVTLAQIAADLGLPVMKAGSLERRALREALAAARTAPPGPTPHG